ncbi:MAG: fibronectin type III domain-containing protein [Ottowia sp.]|uniref:kelch repeat-containing protein n=1 Tax=Ottowia sp. TaxID=1898956 RepID=UPI003C7910FD
MKRIFRMAGVGLSALLWQAAASAAPGWNAEAPMVAARGQHAAALMDDGSVGVFGGVSSLGFVTGSERYSSGAWTSIGDAGITGNVTEAVTLGTGHVLVRTDGSLSARLYDPVANAWLAGGMQTVARQLSSMTLLPDGRVLVAGGNGLSSAELYDPQTRTWAPTASMSAVRYAHGAILLPDGRVLVAGGRDAVGPVPSAEIYDPASATWTSIAPPLIAREFASMALRPDGRPLMAGGTDAGGATTAGEIYDVQANTWTATGNLSDPHAGAMGSPLGYGTVLSSGLVLVAGGSDDARVPSPSAELYDFTTGTWSSAGSMGVGRAFGTANLLPNGDVLFAGGFASDPSTIFYANTERYTPAVPPGPVPVVDALPLLQRASSALTLTGAGFSGPSGLSLPALQLQRVENGAITVLTPSSYSQTSFTSPVLGLMPAGLYMARVVVDGVPSGGRLIRFTDPVGTPSGTPGNAQAVINWTAPVNTGGNPPDGYLVTSSPGNQTCTVDAPATSCTVTGLENGTPYLFTVQAQHPNGLGPSASTATAITPTGGGAAPRTVPVPGLTPAGIALTTLIAAAMAGWARRNKRNGRHDSAY